MIDEIFEFLSSIPRKYFGYIPLPRFFGFKLDRVTLAPGITLIDVRGEKDHELIVAKSPARGALAQALSPPVPFLKVECDGYYHASPKSSAVVAMLARVKTWLSLSSSLDLLDTSPSLGDLLVGVPDEEKLRIAVRDEFSGELMYDLSAPSALSQALTYARLDESRTAFPSSDKFIEMSVSGLETAFRPVARCLANPERNSDLLTAAEWLFDSTKEENHTLAYLYAAIGLEAALGSREDAVKASLADRLSYLVGTSRQERQQIQKRFSDFYSHRSKIVHGKAQRLAPGDEDLMGWGQGMLRSALRRELGLLD